MDTTLTESQTTLTSRAEAVYAAIEVLDVLIPVPADRPDLNREARDLIQDLLAEVEALQAENNRLRLRTLAQ